MDNTIKIWSLSNFIMLACLIGHEDEITSVNFIQKYIVSSCKDNYIKIWNSENF
jgi:WD40 repeat protein